MVCSLLLVVAAAAVGHGYFLDKPAPVGERGDRIDFSSLATVVTIDEYDTSRVQGLSSEYKDDKIGSADASLPLAETSIVKVNFGASLDGADQNVRALVAQHGAKLQRHLERGWSASTAARGDLAGAADINPRIGGPVSTSLVPASLAGSGGIGGRTGVSGLSP
jgi:hypothetical protein